VLAVSVTRRSHKVSIFATRVIGQAIARSVADQACTIRVPVDRVETINKQVHTVRRMPQEMASNPCRTSIILKRR
jgi:RNA polymerase primary sigma factor